MRHVVCKNYLKKSILVSLLFVKRNVGKIDLVVQKLLNKLKKIFRINLVKYNTGKCHV